MRRSMLRLALAAELLCFSNGCAIFRRQKVSAAPTPVPPPAAAPFPEPKPSEPVIGAPKLPPTGAEAPKTATQTAPPPPLPPETPKAKPRRRVARPPVVPEPKPESAPVTPPAPAPRLGDVLSADQRQELTAQLDGNLGAAQRLLGTLSGRPLKRDQAETAARVRSFIEQAQGMRDSDLVTAVELSRRALLLARDLAGAVR